MSSDFGTNKRRVDIKLRAVNARYHTWAAVLDAVKCGERLITVSKDVAYDRVYYNKLCRDLNKIGITDIRYGTMHHLIGGCGYTIYKPYRLLKA